LEQDRQVLKSIAQRFEGKLALNCYVIQGGEIRVGDGVQLLNAREPREVRASKG
jgi:MOSC domain-containing protein YiiM